MFFKVYFSQCFVRVLSVFILYHPFDTKCLKLYQNDSQPSLYIDKKTGAPTHEVTPKS